MFRESTSFDPIGRQRASYADGKPVEDSAVTVDKQEIAGVSGLMQYLDKQEPLVLKNMSHKLIGYALGRTVIAADLPLVNQMAQMGGDARYSDFVVAVATSPQFRNRRGQDGAVLAKDTKR